MVFNGGNLGVTVSDKDNRGEGMIHKCVHKRVHKRVSVLEHK